MENLTLFNGFVNRNLFLNHSLIKGYLRAGRKLNKNFFIDTEFEIFDYCVIMITNKIVSPY